MSRKVLSVHFPLDDKFSTIDVDNVVKRWVLESYYNGFSQGDFQKLNEQGIISDDDGDILEKKVIRLDKKLVQNPNGASEIIPVKDPDFYLGFKYQNYHNGKTWTTKIISKKTKTNHLISLVSEVEFNRAMRPNNCIKPPILLKNLSQLGGLDGDFKIQPNYHELIEHDISKVSDFILGESNNILPIFYFSCLGDGNLIFPKERISEFASKFAGLAHVVIEPNRDFSFWLKEECKRYDINNVYNGAIGIYWPKSYSSIILPRDLSKYDSFDDFMLKKIKDIVETSVNFGLPNDLTWNGLEAIIANYDRIKTTEKKERLFSNKIIELNKDRDYLNNEIKQIKENSVDKSTLNQLEKELFKKEKEITETQQLFELYESEISGLKTENSFLYDQISELETDLNSAKNKVLSLESSINQMKVDEPSLKIERELYLGYFQDLNILTQNKMYDECPAINGNRDEKQRSGRSYYLKNVLSSLPNLSDNYHNLMSLVEKIYDSKNPKPIDIEKLKDFGFTVNKGGNHYVISSPFGVKMEIYCTASDFRAGKNGISEFKSKFF